ncbi:MAG TPA: nicotinamide N-methylase [Rhodospirillaceae bacterium]|nr:nicotinamide N-methylase [Rhodospirillaceae bacterium]
MSIDYAAIIQQETEPRTLTLLPEITLYLAEQVTPLWTRLQTLHGDPDYPPPFWAFAWVGGQALARYLLDHPAHVNGLRVLDFASGSGLGAIAAVKAGAGKVWTCDIDPFAQIVCQLNAAANAVQLAEWGAADFSKPPKDIDLIIAGDICYEHLMAHRSLKWLRLCAEAGIKVLLADPGRAYAPKDGVEELGRLIVPTSPELEETPTREVVIWRLVS